MAVLYITEYRELSKVEAGNRGTYIAPVPQEPPVTTQAVSFTTVTSSADFNAATNFVLIESDSNCHVIFGETPSASTTSPLLTANNPQYRGVRGGRLSVVQTA